MKIIVYCFLAFSFFSGCAFDSTLKDRFDSQPNKKQTLIHDADAFSCRSIKSKTDYYFTLMGSKYICLWPSSGDTDYGDSLIEIIPKETEVQLEKFFCGYGLFRSGCNLIVYLPTVYGDEEIIIPPGFIKPLLGLKYTFPNQLDNE